MISYKITEGKDTEFRTAKTVYTTDSIIDAGKFIENTDWIINYVGVQGVSYEDIMAVQLEEENEKTKDAD